jgi:hypothetical protein
VLTVSHLANCAKGEKVDYKTDLNLILENSTRWNSTYLSLERGLKLKNAIIFYLLNHEHSLLSDRLSEDEWEQLSQITDALEPFWAASLRLQGHGTHGSHGVIWEALVTMDYLLSKVENQKETLEEQQRAAAAAVAEAEAENASVAPPHEPRVSPLLVCYQNAWEKLQKYNNLTDESHEIYAAGALLNPCLRRAYFDARWTHDAAEYIEPMLRANREYWQAVYPQDLTVESSLPLRSPIDQFIISTQTQTRALVTDEYTRYIEDAQTAPTDWKKENLFLWWMQAPYPGLRPWAFDTLSIPATSAELERIFSQAKRTITVDRNRLKDESFEAAQCMKHWLDQDIIGRIT